MPIRPNALAFASFFLCAACSSPSPSPSPLERITAQTGLTSAEVAELQAKKGLDHEDFQRLSPERLRRILARIREPNPDHPAEYQAWRLESLRDENGAIPLDADLRAKQQMLSLARESVSGGLDSSGWTELGPGNIGGRSRTVAIHPTTPSTMLIGSVAGGVWRTTDGGQSWAATDDLMANLAVTSIVHQPGNPSIVFAATGEGFSNADSVRGAGIFRSDDGGLSWARLASTNRVEFQYVTRLAFSADGAVLLAATRTGMWRSTDGGTSFAKVHGSPNARCLDVKFHATSSAVAVAQLNESLGGNVSTVIYTTDGGATWSTSTGISSASTGERTELAWHKGYTGAGNGCVYALKAESSTALYRSLDGGASFALVGTSTILGSQGWYDNALWVDPSDRDANSADDVVVAGGVDLWRSTNGGASFTKISEWSSWPNSAHADQHFIVERPGFDGITNRAVYFTNDGGIWRCDNIYTVSRTSGWINLNHTLGITQFYGGSRHAGAGILVGGTQDNGTLRRTEASGPNAWTTMFGGDGGFCASDAGSSSYHFGEYVYLQIHRSTNGGSSSSYIHSGIADAGSSSRANFIAPFILDPNDSRRLLAGGLELWRCSDARATPPVWSSIKPSVSQRMSAIAVAPGDANRIWVGHNDGTVYRTSNGTAAAPTWTRVDTNAPGLPNRKVLRLTIDPANAQRVFACFAGYATDNLWETTNEGASWSAKSGLPDAPVRDLELHPSRSTWLYAATEVGLLASENGGQSWSSAATPARASIDELFWSGGELYLITHGRGMFRQAPLPFALATRVGTPCRVNGALQGPSLDVQPPVLGTTVRFSLSNLPVGAVALLLASPVPAAPTPLSPGCELHLELALFFTLGAFTPLPPQAAELFMPLPADPYLSGAEVSTQAAAIDAGVLVLSDAQRLRLGY